MRSPHILPLALFTLLAACGSSTPPAQEAPAGSADESSSPAPAESAAPADSAEPAASGGADKGKAPAATDDSPKPTRSPKDVLTGPDVVFMFSFTGSDASKKAEELCDKSSGDDAKKRAECLSRARGLVPHDGIRFKKDDDGQWWWITFKRKGNKLEVLHKIPIEFGEEKGSTIVLKPTGKDKGPKPMNVPKQIVFEIPNEYQIATVDPALGHVVYEAKIGIAGD
jgi:hypothetical protein